LVDIDLLQPLRYKVLVERKGFAFFVELEYEYIPEFCHGCKVIGHNFDQCRKWNKDENLLNDKEIHPKRKAPIAPKQVFVPVNSGRLQQNNMNDGIHNTATNENNNKEIAVINVEESGSRSPQINMVDQENNAETVNNVTPNADAAQLEPVLTPLSPRTIQLQQDDILEKELNDNMDSESVSSSQGSIVKDSQGVEDKNKAIVVSSMPFQDTTTHDVAGASSQPPDRVLKDMAFLKESWANMVEAEETTHEVLHEKDQMESTADGFQVQLTKNQKRAQKRLNQSSKDSYATRSKVVPKPFR
jgi:hypothetical protein